MKIETSSGFKCEVNENKARDWRFTKALAKWDSADGSKILEGVTEVVPFLLGEEGEKKLIQHVTDADGIADTAKILEEFKEIMTLLGDKAKKS